MDIRIQLLRPLTLTAPSGQVTRTQWEPAGNHWAERPRTAASLVSEAGELFENHTATYRLRWGVKVKQGWRIQDPDGTLYSIDTVQHFRRSGIIELSCSRVND